MSAALARPVIATGDAPDIPDIRGAAPHSHWTYGLLPIGTDPLSHPSPRRWTLRRNAIQARF